MDTTENYSLGTKLRADSCLYLFAFTLLYYDHLLTFDDEVNCHPWEEFQEFFHAFAQIIVATLLTMRVYALYARDRRVLIVLTGIILFGIGATVISLVFSESTPAPSLFPIGCHDILDLKNAALVSVGWELVFIYDTLLFGMTVFKAYRARSQPRVKQLEKFSVFTIIVRDGSIYFGIMALANLVNVLTFYLAGVSTLTMCHHATSVECIVETQDTLFRGTLSPFASCMSVTLMSRLMLHLHKITSQGLYAWYGDTVARPADSYTPDATMSLMDFGPKENHYSQESIDHSGDISVPEDTTGQSNSGIPEEDFYAYDKIYWNRLQ
ncbi:hypothetical protein LENED_009261 [Lentinula edodes]|uniref:Uncharacterized protein n=1 Tax=Lentinula edodes TaxID=5353 RepID=A0A1Q3EJB0_LENED|nr:hypothetical protein LENED_009261 [Lentinula edodes]